MCVWWTWTPWIKWPLCAWTSNPSLTGHSYWFKKNMSGLYFANSEDPDPGQIATYIVG